MSEAIAKQESPNLIAIAIWVALVILLATSVLFGTVNAIQATMLAFTIAIMKSYMVIQYYMGLRNEPKWIAAILLGGVLVVYILFGGILSDMMFPPKGGPALP